MALSEFFAQRLIARLAIAFPDQWAPKGGHAMLARLPDLARTTREIDGALTAGSREAATVELEQAASAAPQDRDVLEFRLSCDLLPLCGRYPAHGRRPVCGRRPV